MAVYTQIGDQELQAFLDGYDVGALTSIIAIAEGVENSNYLLITDRARYILTLYEKRVRAADLPFFLGVMDHLAAKDFPCPRPVPDRAGQVLQQLAGRPAALISFLDGMWPRRVWPPHCRGVGGALAALHLAGEGFALARANDLSVAAWGDIAARIGADANADAAAVTPEISDAIGQEITLLEARWPDHLPAGVIHADLFPDNVFFTGEAVSGFIDFYFACNDLFAYDVAVCLNAWCFEPDGQFNITKARAMLGAYRAVRPFSDAELAALPLLCRGAAMRFLLTRLYDWVNTPEDAFVARKDPMEYWRKLRFHQGVTGPGAYGLD